MIKFSDKYLPQVISINVSGGGIPKYPIESVVIKEGGLQGDGHNHEKHYRPIQAVSLQDIEKLVDLRNAGYKLYAGATGENLTVSNLNVNQLPTGTRLRFSGGVEIELSKVRQPCYVLDSIDPRLKNDILGRCGYYAKVIKEGALSVFETIQVMRPENEQVN
ncbi:MAG: MOSC domain-containing protein [Candidatus Omnitrophota bacterium]